MAEKLGAYFYGFARSVVDVSIFSCPTNISCKQGVQQSRHELIIDAVGEVANVRAPPPHISNRASVIWMLSCSGL